VAKRGGGGIDLGFECDLATMAASVDVHDAHSFAEYLFEAVSALCRALRLDYSAYRPTLKPDQDPGDDLHGKSAKQ
jgi:hypothetical protein